jgi:gamma-glutamylcyclotransferase (GGCT)/AIG2-like uncharacterized protein YtfP
LLAAKRHDAMVSDQDIAWLFAYGTLRQSEVQLALFGRLLDGEPDALVGYKLSPLQITDPEVIATSGMAHHTMVHESGNPRDRVPGVLFRISNAELAAADEYEVADVKRVSVRLASGTEAFVYVSALS